MTDISERFERLCALRREIDNVNAATRLLEWDMETLMPAKGAGARADVLATLAGLEHEKRTASAYGELLDQVYAWRHDLPEAWQRRAVELEHQEWLRASKLPAEFVRELTRLTSASHHVWVDAKRRSDFAAFAPSLERIVAMKREEAVIVGAGFAHPYDALLDEYEEGATVADLAPMFEELTWRLAPIVTMAAHDPTGLGRRFEGMKLAKPLAEQERIARRLMKLLGFDPECGVLGVTEHPFMETVHAGDTRVATAYKEHDVLDGVYSVIHEVGHALYEQGLPARWGGVRIGGAVSYAFYESQSRLWENIVGRSMEFAPLLHDIVRPSVPVAAMHYLANDVRPSYIRIEADEVTYNLHIALRFDIERRLIEGSLDVKDVRDAWNAKMKELLGLEVTDDAKGVLQDVHWSGGSFGYFPTYALGNLYAAQLFAKAKEDIPDLRTRIAKGDLATLLGWLREKVHRHASLYPPRELIRRATGKYPDATAFISYVTDKFGELYGLF